MKQGNDLHEGNGFFIGVNGCADGSRAVVSDASGGPNPESKWNHILEECKKLVAPIAHAISGDKLMQHLIEEYGAHEIEISHGQKLALKINVLSNYLPDALQQPSMPQQDADKKTWTKWEQNYADYWHSVQLLSDEKYGLRFACLKVPRTTKAERFYTMLEHERKDDMRKHPKDYDEKVDDMEFELELSTGYIALRNGCNLLMNEIILWRGVTQEDIDKCTPIYIAYVAAMRDTGKIHL